MDPQVAREPDRAKIVAFAPIKGPLRVVGNVVQESHELDPMSVYVRRTDGSPVRFLGCFDCGDGRRILQFRDLRDGGTFYRHADEAQDFCPAPAE